MASRNFAGARLGPHSVVSGFAGLRPLLGGDGDTLSAPREHAILHERGLTTIVGGKLTAWRAMAEELVRGLAPPERARGATRLPPGISARRPLPGGREPVRLDLGRRAPQPRYAALARRAVGGRAAVLFGAAGAARLRL